MTTQNAKYIFDAANDFRIASEILESRFGQKVFPLRSTIVTTAFSAELYLKCLLNIEKNNNSNGHSLKDLYQKLGNNLRMKIEANYKNASSTKKQTKDVLDECKDIFVDWRYIYEKQNSAFSIDFRALRHIVVALDKTVRELKPEWNI